MTILRPFLVCCLYFCALSFLSIYGMFYHSSAMAEILSQEITTNYKQPQKIQAQRNKDGILFIPKNTARYHMLEEMDVYSLSPHAKLLLLPHMLDARTYIQIQNHPHQKYSPSDWRKIAELASQKYGVDTKLILAVIRTESNFIADAISHVGAQGAMQIMPQTALDLGLDEPFNPNDNVEAGTRYLKQQLDRFKSLELALAAYNAGPGNVIKYKGIPPFAETQNFVKKVMSYL